MKHNVALKKNVSIVIRYSKDLYGNKSIYICQLNDVKTRLAFRDSVVENLNEALETNLICGTDTGYVVSVCVKKDVLYINDVAIVEMNYLGVNEVNYALSSVAGYSISVNKDSISYGYDRFYDGCRIQNLSGRIEDVKIVGTDYKTTLNKLMKSYSKKLERNSMYVFEIVEYRGNDKDVFRNNNRLLARESVGYQEDNFDKELWDKLHERR